MKVSEYAKRFYSSLFILRKKIMSIFFAHCVQKKVGKRSGKSTFFYDKHYFRCGCLLFLLLRHLSLSFDGNEKQEKFQFHGLIYYIKISSLFYRILLFEWYKSKQKRPIKRTWKFWERDIRKKPRNVLETKFLGKRKKVS